MQISQVMMSHTQPNSDQIGEKRYLSQFESEMFNSLQEDSPKDAPQFELKSVVSMVKYWVPDLPNIKGITGYLQHSILILFCKWCLVCMIRRA